jgi:hypothetical protein
MENLQLGQKCSTCKVIAKKCVVTKEISAFKKKPSSLHGNNRKDGLKISQESQDRTLQQNQM